MRNTARILFAVAVVASSGCVVKVNGKVHKFGLDGEVKTEENKDGKADGKDGKDMSADELAAQLKSNTPGQSVTYKPDFSPNPVVVGSFTTTGTVDIREQPHGINNCSGYVGESPSAIIKFTSGMKQTRISAPGAKVIVAEFGDRKYICDSSYNENPSVMLNPEWPGNDEIRVYVGGSKGETYNYKIKVEDETRPIDILWKDKGKQVELAEVPKDPIVISELTTKDQGVKGCDGRYFRETPDVVFNLKRPLGDMRIGVRSAKDIAVQFVGPLTADGRKINTQCYGGNSGSEITFGRWEAGTYGLRIGTKTSGEEALYHLVVRGKDSTRNPVFVPTKFVDAATLEESVLADHFPQLGSGDHESDANRLSLFNAAPAAVFVFPKFNMDKTVAQIISYTGDEKKAEYPKENEALLLLNDRGRVLAADGAEFSVNMKDLQADPTGAVFVPAAPRDVEIGWDWALRVRSKEDLSAYNAWERAGNATGDCYARPRGWFEVKASVACASFDASEDRAKANLEKTMLKNRTKNRAATLAKIKPRIETLFKKP